MSDPWLVWVAQNPWPATLKTLLFTLFACVALRVVDSLDRARRSPIPRVLVPVFGVLTALCSLSHAAMIATGSIVYLSLLAWAALRRRGGAHRRTRRRGGHRRGLRRAVDVSQLAGLRRLCTDRGERGDRVLRRRRPLGDVRAVPVLDRQPTGPARDAALRRYPGGRGRELPGRDRPILGCERRLDRGRCEPRDARTLARTPRGAGPQGGAKRHRVLLPRRLSRVRDRARCEGVRGHRGRHALDLGLDRRVRLPRPAVGARAARVRRKASGSTETVPALALLGLLFAYVLPYLPFLAFAGHSQYALPTTPLLSALAARAASRSDAADVQAHVVGARGANRDPP